MAGGLTLAGNLLGTLGSVAVAAIEKAPPADPEARRRWVSGKRIAELAGLVDYLDVRIPDLGATKRAQKLRAIRARTAAELRELRQLYQGLASWDAIATRYRATIELLERQEGAELVWPDGHRGKLSAAFRGVLQDHALRTVDEKDDRDALAAEGGDHGTP